MLVRLALRNLKRSVRDYAVCFTAVAITAAMLFAFNSVIFSETIQNVYEYMQDGNGMLLIVTVVVTLACGWLIDYVTRFLLRLRSREFAVYFTMGMERGQAVLLFFGEQAFIGIASMAVGLLAGTLFFQLLTAVLSGLFETEYRLRLEINPQALLLTIACFAAVYLFALLRCRRLLRRTEIPELLRLPKKNEAARFRSPYVYLALFVLALFLCAGCLIGIREGLLYLDVGTESRMWNRILLGTAAGCIGIPCLYVSLTHLIPYWRDNGRERLYRGTKLFFVRQLDSKMNSSGGIMGAVALLLLLAMTAFSGGAFCGAAVMQNARSTAQFDIMLTLNAADVDFTPQLELIDESLTIRDRVEFPVYTTENKEVLRLLGELSQLHSSYWLDGAQIVFLSDYNGMIRQLGLPPLTLGENEFAVGVNSRYNQRYMENQLQRQSTLSFGGKTLRPAQFDGSTVLFGNQGPWECLLILPDILAESVEKEVSILRSNLIVTTAEGAPLSLAERLGANPVFTYVIDGEQQTAEIGAGEYVDNQGMLVIQNGNTEIRASYAGRGYQDSQGKPIRAFAMTPIRSLAVADARRAAAIVGMSLFYLGLVFCVIAATILAVQQLADSRSSRSRFSLLRKLGLPDKQINLLVLRQLAVYFGLPALLPVLMTTLLMALFNEGFERSIPSGTLWLESLLAMLFLFLAVELCYFLVTFFHFQRNIFEK